MQRRTKLKAFEDREKSFDSRLTELQKCFDASPEAGKASDRQRKLFAAFIVFIFYRGSLGFGHP